MKTTIKKILGNIEEEIDIAKQDEETQDTETYIKCMDKVLLLTNAHVMICNAFHEESKFAKD